MGIDSQEMSTIPMEELKRLRKQCADLTAQVDMYIYSTVYVCIGKNKYTYIHIYTCY